METHTVRKKVIGIAAASVLSVLSFAFPHSSQASLATPIISNDAMTQMMSAPVDLHGSNLKVIDELLEQSRTLDDTSTSLTVDINNNTIIGDNGEVDFHSAFPSTSFSNTEEATATQGRVDLLLRQEKAEVIDGSFDKGEIKIVKPFQRRTIIAHVKIQDTYGAKSATYIPSSGDTVLCYEDENTTEYAYGRFILEYGEENIELDISAKVELREDTETLIKLSSTENPETVYSWGSTKMGITDLKETASSYKKADVLAVIVDSGLTPTSSIFDEKRTAGRIYNGVNIVEDRGVNDTGDSDGHGTACSGIISNGTPDNVGIYPIRIFGEESISMQSMALAYENAADFAKSKGIDKVVFSQSFGLLITGTSTSTDNMYSRLYSNGHMFAAATGNEYAKEGPGLADSTYPANNTHNIAVASVSSSNQHSNFSNSGTCVEVAAPGESLRTASTSGGTNYYFSGTSAATPQFVTALCYFEMIDNSGDLDLTTSDRIRSLVHGYCQDLGDPGRDVLYGYGIPMVSTLFEDHAINNGVTQTIQFYLDQNNTIPYYGGLSTPGEYSVSANKGYSISRISMPEDPDPYDQQFVYYNGTQYQGYVFGGWEGLSDRLTQNIKVHPIWLPSSTIRYHANYEGGNDYEIHVAKGDTVKIDPTPIRDKYLARYWKDGNTSYYQPGSAITINSDLDLYAQWQKTVFDVCFYDGIGDANGGKGALIATRETTYGGSVDAPDTTDIHPDYDFVSWNRSTANITADTDIIANTAIKKVIVRFFDGSGDTNEGMGSLIDIKQIDKFSSVKAPEISNTGYKLAGWSRSLDNIDDNCSIVAQWEKQQFNVNFYDGIGANNEGKGNLIDTRIVDYGQSADAPDTSSIKNTGYHFAAWSTPFAEVYNNIDTKMNWEKDSFAVRFFDGTSDENDGKGKLIDTQNVKYQEAATAPELASLSNPDHIFVQWSADFDNVVSDIDIVAQWKMETFMVCFYDGIGTANDGKGSIIGQPQTVEKYQSASTPAIPNNPGHEFSGWSQSSSNVTQNLDIIATWDLAKFTVRFYDGVGDENDGKGKLIDTQSVPKGGSTAAPNTQDIAYAGHKQSGWSQPFTSVLNDIDTVLMWELQEYDVSFYADADFESSLISSQKVLYGQAAIAPEDPTREHYAFAEWDRPFDKVMGDLRINATWTPDSYDVTFVDGFGSTLKTETVVYNEAATAPDAPSKTGYVFQGWDRQFSHIEENTTITALWKNEEHTVIFTDGMGTTLSTQTVEHGHAAVVPETPSRQDCTFARWDKDFANVTEDMTVNAVWATVVHTVVFQDGFGNILSTQNIEHGAAAQEPTHPTHEGVTFKSWDKPFICVVEDMDITAQWNTNTYTVIFTDGNGTTLSTQSVPYGGKAIAPSTPTREGYNFSGWDKPFDNVRSNFSVNATWIIAPVAQYTVTFEDGYGKTLKTETVGKGGSVTPPSNPTRTGAVFSSWSSTAYKNVQSNLTIRAIWTVARYSVKFTDGMGTTLSTQSVEYGKAATAPNVSNITRTGYIRNGWDKAFSNVTNDLIVNLQWKVNPQTYSFTDVNSKTPHYEHIKWLSTAGITTGWVEKNGTRTFKGTTSILRQDMAAFLHRLAEYMGYAAYGNENASFADVNSSTPHSEDIEWLASTGITTGISSNGKTYFAPTSTVNRQDMAAFLHRFAQYVGQKEPASTTEPFVDVTSATPHYEHIKWLYSTKITTGYDIGGRKYYQPLGSIYRQDMAAFMSRLYTYCN